MSTDTKISKDPTINMRILNVNSEDSSYTGTNSSTKLSPLCSSMNSSLSDLVVRDASGISHSAISGVTEQSMTVSTVSITPSDD